MNTIVHTAPLAQALFSRAQQVWHALRAPTSAAQPAQTVATQEAIAALRERAARYEGSQDGFASDLRAAVALLESNGAAWPRH